MQLKTDECSSENIMEEFKQRIKDRNLTQEAFAKNLGMSRKALNHILNQGITDNITLFRICDLLGIKWISIE